MTGYKIHTSERDQAMQNDSTQSSHLQMNNTWNRMQESNSTMEPLSEISGHRKISAETNEKRYE